jgi:hypothetical protein
MANNIGKKFGRRKKGTPNKLTKELRTLLKDFVFNELETLDKKMNQLESKKRIEILIKLIPYVLPKIESISHCTNEPMEWSFD